MLAGEGGAQRRERGLVFIEKLQKMNQRKHILVTGGAGFLGSHLCEQLLARGHTVLCMDNLYTGSMENIQSLIASPRFTYVSHDITQALPDHVVVDEIYNMACPASPVHYQRDPVQTIKTCVNGAIHVLELAKKLHCKIFQASTSEVYGDPLIHPQTENYWGNVNPNGRRSCYDEGKRCAESLFFCYHQQYNIPIKVARIFNTYGPRMHPNDGRVVTNFMMQALSDNDITIYGDGTQTRSFCYVDDLINGIIAFMELPDDKTGPVNIGNPFETSMTSLAKRIIELTQSRSRIVYQPLPENDPKQRCPDISLAKKWMQFSPDTALDLGLQRTVEYLREKYFIEASTPVAPV